MAKFSALLFREWRISRKLTISQVIAGLFLGMIFLMIRWSMLYGNLQELEEDLIADGADIYADTLKVMFYFSVFTVASIMQLNIGRSASSHKGDIQSGFLRYSYTMPITPSMRSAVKTAYMCIFRVVGYAITVVYALFASIWYESVRIDSTLLLSLLIPAFYVIFHDTIESALVLRARTAKKAGAMEVGASFCMIGVIIVLLGFVKTHLQERMDAVALAEQQRMDGFIAQYGEAKVAQMVLNGEITQDNPVKMILGVFRDMLSEYINDYIIWIVPLTLILIVLGFWLRKKACEGRETP